MKKIAVLLIAAGLVGCSTTTPVVPKWPSVPAEMLSSCPDLKQTDVNNKQISTLLDTVSDNYKEYYDCKAKTDDWITWYKGQQELWKMLK